MAPPLAKILKPEVVAGSPKAKAAAAEADPGATSTSTTDKKEAALPKAPAPMVQAVLLLDNPDEIHRKGIEIKGKIAAELNRGPNLNVTSLDELLVAAKVLLTKLEYMPIGHAEISTHGFQRGFTMARELLELGAKASIAKGTQDGIAEFERYMSQLKQYYFDLKHLSSHESESMYEILGMNLLKLLSQNRISEFHTELELFVHPDASKVLNNVYIRKAVEIEQFLTEGRYNKVLALHTANDEELRRNGLTSPGFKFFIDRVVGNSRGVISHVIETAYDRVSTDFIMQFLNIRTPGVSKELLQVLEERNWKLGGDGYVYFHGPKNTGGSIPSAQLALDSLNYAKELDTIV